MASREEGWTQDEDFFLAQGHAIFGNDFEKIRMAFPFKEARDAHKLADRWQHINEMMETEDRETQDKLSVTNSRFSRTTWNYTEEPTMDVSNEKELIQTYESFSSLATKLDSVPIMPQAVKREGVSHNESCLNIQFDTATVKSIIEKVLRENIEDTTLRDTLFQEFFIRLIEKGRLNALEDIGRRLEFIATMKDTTQAETESQIVEANVDSILVYLFNRCKNHLVNVQQIDPDFFRTVNMMFQLYKILSVAAMERPQSHGRVIKDKFHRKFIPCMAQILGRFATDTKRLKMLNEYFEKITEIDPEKTFDSQLPQLPQRYMAILRNPKAA